MISKSELKFIKSLQIKKFRKEHKQFLIQGKKSVEELASSDFKTSMVLTTANDFQKYKALFPNVRVEEVKEDALNSISSLKTNNAVLAVAEVKPNNYLQANDEYVVVLDDVRDPGNLGTIIRICDWYGVRKIVCSEESADLYNPKVIASSMGSFTRVALFYTSLVEYFEKMPGESVMGAVMNGESVYSGEFPANGYLIMGNESNGIETDLIKYINNQLTIPRLGGAESLNVGVATAVILDNLIRAKAQ